MLMYLQLEPVISKKNVVQLLIFERYMDSNLESCRQLIHSRLPILDSSHSSLYLATNFL
jgi:hypothetical protein